MAQSLTIAVSKGRIYTESLPLLAKVGVCPLDDPESSRRLLLDTDDPDVKLLLIRAQDVPTFVEHGAADIGIAGKDVLLEYPGDAVYEPLDLGISRCRMVVAGRAGKEDEVARPRVATKYVNTARRYYAGLGIQAEIIRLYGSMELAPLTGLADRIVDLVDSGATLLANGLVELETISHISSRLIVNKGSMKMKHTRVTQFIRALEAVLPTRLSK